MDEFCFKNELEGNILAPILYLYRGQQHTWVKFSSCTPNNRIRTQNNAYKRMYCIRTTDQQKHTQIFLLHATTKHMQAE